jgi:hypothetical protein
MLTRHAEARCQHPPRSRRATVAFNKVGSHLKTTFNDIANNLSS